MNKKFEYPELSKKWLLLLSIARGKNKLELIKGVLNKKRY
jgi:hypothetical protein